MLPGMTSFLTTYTAKLQQSLMFQAVEHPLHTSILLYHAHCCHCQHSISLYFWGTMESPCVPPCYALCCLSQPAVFCTSKAPWKACGRGCFPLRRGSIRTARAPRQVFEQLLQEMVYRERSCRWYLVGSEALPFPLTGFG